MNRQSILSYHLTHYLEKVVKEVLSFPILKPTGHNIASKLGLFVLIGKSNSTYRH